MSASRTFRRPFAPKSRTADRRPRLAVQSLEDRSLMSGVTATLHASDWVLRVTGTDAADYIRVVKNGGIVSVPGTAVRVMYANGSTLDAAEIHSGYVNGIEVYGLGGADTVSI
jgi:hypothetical protein